ncbi:glycine zipper 2TM domain-containing protein [Arenimonas oryziterrae]|uniref:Glycine zipper 2TM domain-containing protein n=1 Tax=Arenimonas oryziterrae DSM 21050 = YC6267 TaxID=1121015 RepID=A0A091BES6_9GAMM|nr:glycine zipper 2TM domain-containing protein [Arenimonas oryziterrae]KFN42885.1 hypothetical protein N789_12205 [Arenimonas oryziterrae DSM 21050 = YC6267]
MNKSIAVAIGSILAAGAAVGAYRTGIIGKPYADVVSATPITVKEPVYGEVVDVSPITRTAETSQEVCSDKQVQSRAPERFGDKDGMVAGAVIGGLVGNQVGKGNGRTLATIAGAVGGGYAGREIDRRHVGGRVTSSTQTVCHTETRPSTRTIGYDVTYSVDGQLANKQVASKPKGPLLVGERDKVIGYDVTWRYGEQTGVIRMDHAPGDRLPMQDGAIIVATQPVGAPKS